MKTAFIIHWTGGHSQENWFPWMKDELEKLGITTIVPDFWDDEFPDIEHWKEVFKKYADDINEDTILIGHSLGWAFLLKFLETFSQRVHLLVTVSSPIGVKPIKFYKWDSDFLNGFDFDWENIKNKPKNKIVFHSDNDPYVGLWNGQELAKNLDTELVFISNCGHFNEASGYTKFPELLEKIMK